MNKNELCRRIGHDWKEIGIHAQCQTCGVTVRWREGGGSTGKTYDELLREKERDNRWWD